MIEHVALSRIRAKQNNRESFADIDSLAASIAQYGLMSPITIEPANDGNYTIIAGERRYRAHVMLGLETIKADIVEKSPAESYLMTLLENDNRQQTNDIEKAKGYHKAICDHGLTMADLAIAVGRRQDYIERRLSLLRLRPDVQKMVSDGTLPITYANCMVDLDNNRQLLAIKALNDNPTPTVTWYRKITGELLDQQNQQSFDFGLFGNGDDMRLPDELKVILPDDPAGYRPRLDPANMIGSLELEISKWAIARDGWRELGKDSKAGQCQAIIDILGAIMATLPAAMPAESDSERIRRLILDHGSMTTREIYQFGNIARAQWQTIKAEIGAALIETPAGRGYRYSIAQ